MDVRRDVPAVWFTFASTKQSAKAGVLLLLALLGVCQLVAVSGAPASAMDVFMSPCAFIDDPPPTGFKRWSSKSTWPGGVVPGVGSAAGSNVTIPCGQAVLLDVPTLTLGILRVQGLLKFQDDPRLPEIYVKADFVVVEGQLSIGTPAQQFRQKATIELTPNTRNGRASLGFTSFAPADPANPRGLGHKAFAVVGGQLRLHGLPGPGSMPVWGKLSATAKVNDWSIKLDKNVADSWPVGAQIAVASTDYDMNQAELFTIKKVVGSGSGSVITLDRPLRYMHYGDSRGLPDGFGGFVDQRAEVALLSRNIVITGTDEPAPYQYEGGHFMVFMTPTPQYIEGVEFYKLGQQGSLGRYSIHFHVNGNTPQTVCRKNSIHQSKQRCIVVHACHNMTLESNVAFNTSGHCFMTEEGGEQGNKFINNLGFLTKPVTQFIMLPGTNPPQTEETDMIPATFWMANPQNHLIGNVGAGAADSSFWFELRSFVRGLSTKIPALKNINPHSMSLGTISGNVAHSNGMAGLRTYPHGNRPRNMKTWTSGKPGTISGLVAYKNAWMGMFVHNTDLLTITNCTFADNGWGLHLKQEDTITFTNSVMVALTKNYGNPTDCSRADTWAKCRPVSTTDCSMPLKAGAQGRSTGAIPRVAPTYGVVLDQNRRTDGTAPVNIKNVKFANYNACWRASAIVTMGASECWNPSHNVQGLKFAGNSQPVWLAPRISQVNIWNTVSDGGEQAQFYTLQDKDGSIVGRRGYIVVNNSQILPPGLKGCKAQPSWNAYSCAGACYRTVFVGYGEPGFTSNVRNAQNVRGDFSSLKVTRVSDGKVLELDGNLRKTMLLDPPQRYFHMTLLANQVYRIEVVPSPRAPNFTPVDMTLRYRDKGDCGGLTLQVKEVANKPWTLTSLNSVSFKQCPGTATIPSTAPVAQCRPVCVNKAPWMEVVLATNFQGAVNLNQGTGSENGACAAHYQCSMLWSGNSQWLYDASGLERRPIFYNPVVSFPANWEKGTAPLGFTSYYSNLIQTLLPRPSAKLLTYYFRQPFTLKDTNCYSSLQIEMIVEDGVVVYLNNRELMRSNMRGGMLSNSTTALSNLGYAKWQTFIVPLTSADDYYLVEGTNTIAVEQHAHAQFAYEMAFDMRISGTRKASCSGAKITPEICDGVDNNNNGKVDEGADGKPLTQPCSTSCGTGIATCIQGIFQQCTAGALGEEVCDGKDNDCDGLVDNGVGQMDCKGGLVCSRGKCLPVGNATVPQQVWPRSSSGWTYYDKGGNLDEISPNWREGGLEEEWPSGRAPLGFNTNPPSWEWLGTTMTRFTKDGKSLTAYFIKTFSLTQSSLDSTYSIDFNVRRVDGAVIYLNGVEVWRTNMKSGPILWNSPAVSTAQGVESSPGCCNLQWIYHQCSKCGRHTSSSLKVGTNVIAAELHMAYKYKEVAAFDMDLHLEKIVPCSSLPGSPAQCVRQVQQSVSPPNAVWKYSDGSLPLPPRNWQLPIFDDKAWKSGIAPLGYGEGNAQHIIKTNIDSGLDREAEARRTYYFRRTIDVPDASCYFQLSSSLLSNDGAIVYINGLEVIRRNLPSGAVDSTVLAKYRGDWKYQETLLSGGWLKAGRNVLAVELHRAVSTTIFFDLQILGYREAVTCLPAPS